MAARRKLSDEQVAAIRADDRPLADVAREFGVSIAHVCNIRNGRKRAPNSDPRPPMHDYRRFAKLGWLAKAPIGSTVLLEIDKRRAGQGSLTYWQQKFGVRFRRRMTNRGLRVWRIA